LGKKGRKTKREGIEGRLARKKRSDTRLNGKEREGSPGKGNKGRNSFFQPKKIERKERSQGKGKKD